MRLCMLSCHVYSSNRTSLGTGDYPPPTECKEQHDFTLHVPTHRPSQAAPQQEAQKVDSCYSAEMAVSCEAWRSALHVYWVQPSVSCLHASSSGILEGQHWRGNWKSMRMPHILLCWRLFPASVSPHSQAVNHRIAEVGRDLWRSSSLTSLPKVLYNRSHRKVSRQVLSNCREGNSNTFCLFYKETYFTVQARKVYKRWGGGEGIMTQIKNGWETRRSCGHHEELCCDYIRKGCSVRACRNQKACKKPKVTCFPCFFFL